ncbi:MAG: TetR/AcrR family transcriptional regulator [Cyanobacteria bacterium CRU_2_1]|nr:TetR/AcrR family transcriptional regulator [Cyanobacteria bacterium RU_5_0]NJR58958.1 TetR/AcrR family transcriptional regulator [Cyanobacteria bacterium CRU_2_1]
MPRKISTTPRKLPQQDRSKITVDAILTATARILTEEGYDKASTNRIAEMAGVSIGSLYQYFPNKEALVAALAEHHENEMIELVQSKLNDLFDAPIEIVLPELVKACMAAHAVNPTLHKVLNEQLPRIAKLQQVNNAEEQILNLFRAYLEKNRDRIRPQNLDLTVFILGCTVESLCHEAVIEHPELLSNGELEEEVSNLLLNYLIGETHERK